MNSYEPEISRNSKRPGRSDRRVPEGPPIVEFTLAAQNASLQS